MDIFVKSLKRVGRSLGMSFAPVQSVEMQGKNLVPVSKMVPVVMVALIDQLVLVPAQDVLVLWSEDEVTAMSALEQEVAQRVAELNKSTAAPEDQEAKASLEAGCVDVTCENCDGFECGSGTSDQQQSPEEVS